MYIDDGFQINIFLLSVGFGVLLAFLYDLFRLIHRLIFKSSKGIFFIDLSYCVISSILTFLFLLAVNYGKLRIYLLAGAVLGFLCWYIGISPLFLKFSQFIGNKLIGLLTVISSIISYPFRLISKPFAKVFYRNSGFFKKYFIKLKNISKIHLKKK